MPNGTLAHRESAFVMCSRYCRDPTANGQRHKCLFCARVDVHDRQGQRASRLTSEFRRRVMSLGGSRAAC